MWRAGCETYVDFSSVGAMLDFSMGESIMSVSKPICNPRNKSEQNKALTKEVGVLRDSKVNGLHNDIMSDKNYLYKEWCTYLTQWMELGACSSI